MYTTRSKSKAAKLSDCTNTFSNLNQVAASNAAGIAAKKPLSVRKAQRTVDDDQELKKEPSTVKTEMATSNDENASSSSKYFEAPALADYNIQMMLNGIKDEPTDQAENVLEGPVKYQQLPNESVNNRPKHKIKKEQEEDQDDVESNVDKKVKWEPENWRQVFGLIRQMRQGQDAPVDTMGCDALANLDQALTPKEQRFQVLVSLMLSAQTKDEVTAAATNRLQKLPLNVHTMTVTDEETIAQLIYPVSFYKRKAQYIKRTAQILKDAYDSDIPNNVAELCKLPGVGPKMAYIAMHVAWNNCAGIGVDTHVHRISNRLGWVRKTTKIPEQTRKELEEWLPLEFWNEVNHMLVGFGQQTCRPIGPKCGICLAKDLCPTGQTYVPKKSSKARVKAEIKIETE